MFQILAFLVGFDFPVEKVLIKENSDLLTVNSFRTSEWDISWVDHMKIDRKFNYLSD